MKKTAFVVLLAAVFVLAVAGSAFAISLDPTYTDWTDGPPNDDLGTPHADYQLHTQKCAVCHAVHNAPATVPVGATGETELLLRSAAADACTYCHIDSNVGGKVVYDGVASNYRDDLRTNHDDVAQCTQCHSVHSANTIGGAVQAKILRDGQVANGANFIYQDEYQTATGLATEAQVDAAARDIQVTMFCTKCHDMYSGASETTVSAQLGAVIKDVKHHPLKSAAAVFAAQGATTNTTVAWVDANYCRSCHDAGAINQPAGTITSSWPHYTPGAVMFLLVGTDAASRPASGTTNPANGADAGADDGACIKCHIEGSGPLFRGVGSSY